MKKQLNLIVYLTFAIFSFNVQANLISNSGFEAGLTNWQNSNASIRANTDPSAYEGSRYVYGQGTAAFNLWQDIDLSLNFSGAEIDTGNLDIYFGGWQSGWNDNDVGQISIHLFDTNMAEIGTTAFLDAFTSLRGNADNPDGLVQGWQLQSGTIDLLSGTRYIRYEFTGTRNFGNNNDAYLDAAFLDIITVPVPAAVWLFGSGLLGLAGVARRKAHA